MRTPTLIPRPRHTYDDEEPDILTLYTRYNQDDLGGGCKYCGYTSHFPNECPMIQRASL